MHHKRSQQIEREGCLPDQFPNDMMSVLSRVKTSVSRSTSTRALRPAAYCTANSVKGKGQPQEG